MVGGIGPPRLTTVGGVLGPPGELRVCPQVVNWVGGWDQGAQGQGAAMFGCQGPSWRRNSRQRPGNAMRRGWALSQCDIPLLRC
jgi:hypothetical protein